MVIVVMVMVEAEKGLALLDVVVGRVLVKGRKEGGRQRGGEGTRLLEFDLG